MLTEEDIKRGYPVKKETTALCQFAIIIVLFIILAFILGQFLRDFNIFVAKVVFR